MMKQLFISICLALLMLTACQWHENADSFPYNVPAEYLEEASEIPDFWLSTTKEVETYLKTNVKKGKVELLGKSAGGRPIYAVSYGEGRRGRGTTTFSAATGINKIRTYRGPESDKLVYMAIAAVHGSELEGIVGVMNMISVFETGKDLNGKTWPQLESMTDSLDRIVLIPICNPDGRDRLPIRMEKFRGHEPDAFTVHEYLNTGGTENGKLIGWPACKEYVPMDFDQFEFPGCYPNDNGYNIQHDNFFGELQPETRIIFDLAERERPDILLNLHTGVSREDYFIEVCPPCVGAVSPLLENVWYDFYKAVHTELTLGGFRETDDVVKESTPRKLEHRGSGNFNLSSALSFLCGALTVTIEDGSHGYTGIYPDGSPVEHTPLKILNAELTLHQSAMQFLLENGGVDSWEQKYIK